MLKFKNHGIRRDVYICLLAEFADFLVSCTGFGFNQSTCLDKYFVRATALEENVSELLQLRLWKSYKHLNFTEQKLASTNNGYSSYRQSSAPWQPPIPKKEIFQNHLLPAVTTDQIWHWIHTNLLESQSLKLPTLSTNFVSSTPSFMFYDLAEKLQNHFYTKFDTNMFWNLKGKRSKTNDFLSDAITNIALDLSQLEMCVLLITLINITNI